MRTYELFCVLPGTLAETDVAPVVEKALAIITKEGGADATVQDLGKSRLAYPMRHIRYGYFRVCRFHADPASAKRVYASVRLLDDMLRAMLFQDDHASHIASGSIQPVDHIGTDAHTAPEARPVFEPAVEIKKPVEKPVESDERVLPAPAAFEDIDKQLDKLLEKDIAGV